MAAPARGDAPAPAEPGPDWGEVRRRLAAAAEDVADAVTFMCLGGAGPAGAAERMAERALARLAEYGELARSRAFDDDVVRAECARAVEQDRAARRAAARRRGRGRLRAV